MEIDAVFSSAINFGIFKDDLCGINNIKISGILKVHTTIGGSTISGLVSSATIGANNITSSLQIIHTGFYLDRCSHIASNTMTDGKDKVISITNITLSGSISVTGTSDYNYRDGFRNIGGIIARASGCVVNISGVALNGYSISHTQTLRGVALLIG